MSNESYETHVMTEPAGTAVRLADVSRFDWHRRTCEICAEATYSYLQCPDGIRLAKRAMQPLSAPAEIARAYAESQVEASLR